MTTKQRAKKIAQAEKALRDAVAYLDEVCADSVSSRILTPEERAQWEHAVRLASAIERVL